MNCSTQVWLESTVNQACKLHGELYSWLDQCMQRFLTKRSQWQLLDWACQWTAQHTGCDSCSWADVFLDWLDRLLCPFNCQSELQDPSWRDIWLGDALRRSLEWHAPSEYYIHLLPMSIAVSLLQIWHSAILTLQCVHLSTGEAPNASPWKKSPWRGGEIFCRTTCLITEAREWFFPNDPRGTYPDTNLDL